MLKITNFEAGRSGEGISLKNPINNKVTKFPE